MKKIFTIYLSAENIFSARFEATDKGLRLLNIGSAIIEHEADDAVSLVLPSNCGIFSSQVPGRVATIGKESMLKLADLEIASYFPQKTSEDFILRTDEFAAARRSGESTSIEFIPKNLITRAKKLLPPDFRLPDVENIISSADALTFALLYNYPDEWQRNVALLDFNAKGQVQCLLLRDAKLAADMSFTYSDLSELKNDISAMCESLGSSSASCIEKAYLTGKFLDDEIFATQENAFNGFLVSVKFLNPFRLISGNGLQEDACVQFCIDQPELLAPVCGAAASAFYQPILLKR